MIKAYVSINGAAINQDNDGTWMIASQYPDAAQVSWKTVPQVTRTQVMQGDTIRLAHTSLDTNRLYASGIIPSSATGPTIVREAAVRIPFQCQGTESRINHEE